MRFVVGGPGRLKFTVRDSTGALVDATTVTLSITLPDGTAAPALTLAGGGVTRESVGTYYSDYTPAVPGLFAYVWSSTGPATVWGPDSFTVAAVTDAPIVSTVDMLEELVKFTEGDEALLLGMLAEATEKCENLTRTSWRRRTLTEVHSSGAAEVHTLRGYAVQSVTSVVLDGTALTPGTDYVLTRTGAGLVRGNGKADLCWPDGVGNLTVTYVVGPPAGVVPDDILSGIKEYVRGRYSSHRGGTARARTDDGNTWSPSATYSITRKVEQAWSGYARPIVGGCC